MNRAELLALAERVENITCSENWTDVQVEIALFKPNSCFSAIRSNDAGSKVIYRDQAGNDVTCWAEDWTLDTRRVATAAALRARAEEVGDA